MTEELKLDKNQRYAFSRFGSWLESEREDKPQVFRLFGVAGSGKTTLATHIARKVDTDLMLFAAFTGKASKVLSDKLRNADLPYSALTIHKLIYIPVPHENGEVSFVLNQNSILRDATLLVIDEVSMVSRKIAKDLESFEVPMLVIGDPEQLPPVRGREHYIGRKPDVFLPHTNRQALDNPILRISEEVREGKRMPDYGDHGTVKVLRHHELTPEILLGVDIRLVGKNSTRHLMNDQIRALRGFRGDIPGPGETVVCLRNSYKFHVELYNGSLWTVLSSEKYEAEYKGRHHTIVEMEIFDEFAQTVTVEVPVEFFVGLEEEVPEIVREQHQQFAFGYALTVHKSQGSEWDKVLMFDQPLSPHRRWRYTAITRASKELIIVR
jgi:exodeoxyribonuclease-5